MIAVGGGREQIDAIKFASGKIDGLAVGRNRIGLSRDSGSKRERDARVIDFAWQHFSRQSLTLRSGGTIEGTIEASARRLVLNACHRHIVRQGDGCELRRRYPFRRGSQLHSKAARLISSKRCNQLASLNCR